MSVSFKEVKLESFEKLRFSEKKKSDLKIFFKCLVLVKRRMSPCSRNFSSYLYCAFSLNVIHPRLRYFEKPKNDAIQKLVISLSSSLSVKLFPPSSKKLSW